MKKFLFLVLPLLLLSCAKEEQVRNVDIHLNDWSSEIDFTDLFKVSHRIQLDNKQECYIHKNSIVKFAGDHIYIHDRESETPNILVFDKDGKFINQIGSFGQGPGEYSRFCAFAINEEKGEIVILGHSSTFFVYDTDGKFLYSKKLEESIYNLERLSDCYIAASNPGVTLSEEGKFLFYKLDDDFNVIDAKFRPAQDQNCIATSIPYFFKRGENALYLNQLPSIVYEYDCKTDTAGVIYKFIYPNQMPPEIYSDVNSLYINFSKYNIISSFAVNYSSTLVTYLTPKPYTVEIDNNGNVLHKINFNEDISPSSIFGVNDTFVALEDNGGDDNLAIVIYERIK